MRGIELSGERREDPAGNNSQTLRSFLAKPTIAVLHPPLVSGGWYEGAEQEVSGPGRYPIARPVRKSMVAALVWTLCLGPLGLCYLSVAAGLVAAAVAAVVFLAGGFLTLAVMWPAAIVLAALTVWRQRSRRSRRGVGSGASFPEDERTGNTWFLSNV
jgi:hypothetical protein